MSEKIDIGPGEPPAFMPRAVPLARELDEQLRRAAKLGRAVRVHVRFEPVEGKATEGFVTFLPSAEDPIGSYYTAVRTWTEKATLPR